MLPWNETVYQNLRGRGQIQRCLLVLTWLSRLQGLKDHCNSQSPTDAGADAMGTVAAGVGATWASLHTTSLQATPDQGWVPGRWNHQSSPFCKDGIFFSPWEFFAQTASDVNFQSWDLSLRLSLSFISKPLGYCRLDFICFKLLCLELIVLCCWFTAL